MDVNASSEFLISLKKKQRMKEYWNSRIKKDFIKNDKPPISPSPKIIDKSINNPLK